MDQTAQAVAIIFVSTDDAKTWQIVKPEAVPAWIKEPEVMANLLHGEMAQSKESPLDWYRAQRVDDAFKCSRCDKLFFDEDMRAEAERDGVDIEQELVVCEECAVDIPWNDEGIVTLQ